MKKTLSQTPPMNQHRILVAAVLSAITVLTTVQVKAQTVPPVDPNEIKGEGFAFTGDSTRIGVGLSREFSRTKFRGDVLQVFSQSDRSALIGEAWLGDSAGGLKLSYNIGVGDGTGPGVKISQVRKAFVAIDQNRFDDRKLSFGAGWESPSWFGNAYISTKASKKRSVGQIATSSIATISGTDAGRPFLEDETTTITRTFSAEPYRYGLGVRAGHFFEAPILRVTGGLDYERGREGAKQTSVSLNIEKYFENSPHSIALNIERYSKSGSVDTSSLNALDFGGKKSDTRAFAMYRYTFGKPFRLERPYKMVGKEVLVAAPIGSAAPVNASVQGSGDRVSSTGPTAGSAGASPQTTTRIEKRLVKTTASATSESFFDLDKYVLKPRARIALDEVVTKIKQNNYEGNIRVSGHTCDLASDAYNLRLSKRRADAVRSYLVKKGLPADRLLSEGMGESNPKYPNSVTERPKNRRVDIEYVTYVERTEDVSVPVTVEPVKTADAQVTPVTPSPKKEIVWEKQYIEQEPAWVRRALLNPPEHKRGVDVYTTSETTTSTTKGNRRFVNRAPAAVNDAYRVALSSTTTFDVIANDTDADSDALTITSVTAPSGGTATISGNKIVYIANATSLANDLFSYVVRDKDGLTATATVTVTKFDSSPPVVNRPPVAADDTVTTSPGKTVTIDALANDSDPDGDKLMIESISTNPRFGTASIVDGKIVYVPGPRFGREGDFFSYTIKDGKGGSATAMIRIICV